MSLFIHCRACYFDYIYPAIENNWIFKLKTRLPTNRNPLTRLYLIVQRLLLLDTLVTTIDNNSRVINLTMSFMSFGKCDRRFMLNWTPLVIVFQLMYNVCISTFPWRHKSAKNLIIWKYFTLFFDVKDPFGHRPMSYSMMPNGWHI